MGVAVVGGQAVKEDLIEMIRFSLSGVFSRVPSFESGCIGVTPFGVCWHDNNEKVSFP